MSARTVLFMPESAHGPTNNCIGIADVLRRRGHRIVFAVEPSWRGRLEPLGFEEALVELAPPAEAEAPQDAGQFWKDFIRETAPEFRKPPIEQLATFMQPTWQALVEGARYCEPRLRSIIAEQRPDVVVEDNVVGFAALVTSGAPYVRIVSCNPLEIRDTELPPPYSGLSSSDRSGWQEFAAEYDRTHRELWEEFNSWMQEQGAPALPDLEFIHASSALNLYVYPEALDYARSRPLGRHWERLDSSVRTTDAPYELPSEWSNGRTDGDVVYLSLGSLGSADTELLSHLVDVLGRTRHRYVVSLGPQAGELTLPDNMTGAEFVPQTSVLPLVDLVITHGGNNTVTEAMHFGKPMVVLPLFWDQYDNAQRVAELGYGVRLDTYRFTEQELHSAVEVLLADTELRRGLDAEGRRIRARRGLVKAADRIEEAAAQPAT